MHMRKLTEHTTSLYDNLLYLVLSFVCKLNLRIRWRMRIQKHRTSYGCEL